MNLIKHTKDHLPYSTACSQLCAVYYNVKRKNHIDVDICCWIIYYCRSVGTIKSTLNWLHRIVDDLASNFKVASRRGSGSLRFAIISVVLKLGGETAGANQVDLIWWIDEIATLETDTFILASAVSSSLSSCCQKMQLTSKKWKGAVLTSPS